MNGKPHVVWHGVEPSVALGERIADEVTELNKTWPSITATRVVIEKPHRHQKTGAHYLVKIEVTVPGKMLVVDHDPSEHAANEDPWAAVNEAFAQMQRQLGDYTDVRRGDVKKHDNTRTRAAAGSHRDS